MSAVWHQNKRGVLVIFFQEIVDEDDSDSDFSASSYSIIESDDKEEWDEDGNICVLDMIGNCLLPIDKLSYVF